MARVHSAKSTAAPPHIPSFVVQCLGKYQASGLHNEKVVDGSDD